MKRYLAKDFATLFGITENQFPKVCNDFVLANDFCYESPDVATHDDIVLKIIKHIDSDQPTRVGEHRADIWESCWSENLQKFVGAEHDLARLVPDFIKTGLAIRLAQNYIIPKNSRFEEGFLEVCRAFLFDRFFANAKSVYEFGCGSGFNLVALSRQFPGKKLYGLDWSKSANETVGLLRKNLEIDITGRHFDFFNPDRDMKFDPGSAVLTMCALEQVGPRHQPFVDFLLEKKPDICVNMEPLVDLYDENNLADYLAARYHRKRGYLDGFLPHLKSLEFQKKIEIIAVRRFFFGSMYHEGYSYVAWRPL
jgi:SAM-dependent methyltransferase